MSFRILIVDDEEKIRRLLGNVLKKSGFTDLPPSNWSSVLWHTGPEKGDLDWRGRDGSQKRSSGSYGRQTRGCRFRRSARSMGFRT